MHSLLLFALSQVIHAEEGNGATVVRLEVDLGRQGARIPNTQLALLLLAKDDVAEVDSVLLDADQCLLAGALEGNVDTACL